MNKRNAEKRNLRTHEPYCSKKKRKTMRTRLRTNALYNIYLLKRSSEQTYTRLTSVQTVCKHKLHKKQQKTDRTNIYKILSVKISKNVRKKQMNYILYKI